MLFASSASGGFDPLGLVVLALFVLGWIFVSYRRRQMFRRCGEKLGLTGLVHDAESLSGELRGLHLHVAYSARGRSSPERTSIDVSCEPCELLLALRRETAAEARAVAQGQAVDVVTGDDRFDAAWVVEGAPLERVLRLLSDQGLRDALLSFSSLEQASVLVEDGKVKLEWQGSEIGPDGLATERIELAIALAEAVIAEARAPIEAEGTYRSAATDRGVEKIAALKSLRAERSIRSLRRQLAYGFAIGPAFLLFGSHMTKSGAPAIVFIVPMQLFATFYILRQYAADRRNAPGVSLGLPSFVWMAASWALLLYLGLR